MKQIVVAIVVIFAAVAAFKYFDRYRTADANRSRVEVMLKAMSEKDEQTALCRWALDKDVADRDTMNAYYDRYLRFVSASGLDGSGWSVSDAKPAGDGRTSIVSVRNGDRTVTLKVAEGLPIELQE